MIILFILLFIISIGIIWIQAWAFFKILDVFIDELTHKDDDSKGK